MGLVRISGTRSGRCKEMLIEGLELWGDGKVEKSSTVRSRAILASGEAKTALQYFFTKVLPGTLSSLSNRASV